jgi:hypothetical protein
MVGPIDVAQHRLAPSSYPDPVAKWDGLSEGLRVRTTTVFIPFLVPAWVQPKQHVGPEVDRPVTLRAPSCAVRPRRPWDPPNEPLRRYSDHQVRVFRSANLLVHGTVQTALTVYDCGQAIFSPRPIGACTNPLQVSRLTPEMPVHADDRAK